MDQKIDSFCMRFVSFLSSPSDTKAFNVMDCSYLKVNKSSERVITVEFSPMAPVTVLPYLIQFYLIQQAVLNNLNYFLLSARNVDIY